MQKKIKIALVFDGLSLPPKDGVTYRAYNLMKGLSARKDIDVQVYLADRGWVSQADIEAEGFKGKMFPANWLTENSQKIADMMTADGIDIIHICNSHDVVPFFGLELAQMTGARLVCDMHDVNHLRLRSMGKDEAAVEEQLSIQKLVGDCSDHVFVMSSSDLPDIEDMGFPLDKLTLAPNGIDVYEGRILDNKEAKKVLFIGNMTYEPNREAAELIIRDIAPKVLKKHPDVEFHFIGRTPDELRKYESSSLHFLGEVDDLKPHLLSSTIGIAPLVSGSGMKVKMLTYASHALPVIGTPVALMGYEQNEGFIIVNEANSIAEQLSKVLDHPQDLSLRGHAARDYVRKKFAWPEIIDSVVKQYKKTVHTKLDRGHWCINRVGKDVEVNGTYCSFPLFMTEERFTKDVPKYTKVVVFPRARPSSKVRPTRGPTR